jgi:transposase
VEQLDQLLSARKSLNASLAAFALQARELQHATHTLAPVIAALQEQKAAVDKQIAQRTAQQEEFSITRELEKVPGIGPVTAATLASRSCWRRGRWSLQVWA